MATTEEFKNGGSTSYSFAIEYPTGKESSIKVKVDGTPLTYTTNPTNNTQYKVVDATVTLGAAAASGTGNVHIYRETNLDTAAATFVPGSAIRAADLNACHDMVRLASQEQNQLITNADVANTAEIAVSKLADGTARQLLQTDSAGTGVEWTSNVDIPGTLAVTGNTTFDGNTVLGTSDSNFVDVKGKFACDLIPFLVPRDLGNSSDEWHDLYIDGTAHIDTLDVDENATVAGTLGVTGNTTVGGTFGVTGNTTVGGTFGVTGSTTFDGSVTATTFTGNVTGNTSGTAATVTGAAQSAITSVGTLTGLNVDGNIHLDAANKEFAIKNGSGVNKFHVDSDSGNTTIQGTLGVNSLTALTSDLAVVGNTTIYGNTTIGDANTDTVTITAKLNSDLIPSATSIDLGTSSTRFGDIFGTTVDVTGNITAAGLTGGVLVDASEHSAATVNDTTVFSTAASDARYYIQTASTDEVIKSNYFTWPTDGTKDDYVATPGAIDKRITQIVDDVGGFVAIANEGSFPTSNPDPSNDAGTIVSITALSAERTANGSGVLTTGFTTTGSPGQQVTINNCGNGQVFAAGYGLLVQTTSTQHTYDFVRYVPNTSQVATVAANTTNINTVAGKATEIGRLGTADAVSDMNTLGTTAIVEDMSLLGTAAVVADMDLLAHSAVIADMATIADTSNLITNIGTVAGSNSNITTVATNISSVNDFHDKYRIASSAPGSNNDDGDLYYNTTDNKLYIYNGSSWDVATELNATGGTVTGDTTFTDNTNLQLGTGNDLKIFHDGTNNRIDSVNGHIYLRVNSTENAFKGTQNGNVEISYDGVKKLETTSTGVLVTELTNSGNTTFNGDYVTFSGTNTAAWDKSNTRLLFNDNAKAAFGTGADLQIYHTGSKSYIKDTGTGSLRINSDDFRIYNAADDEYMLRAVENGAVELYYDNAKKLETFSWGVQNYGHVALRDNDKHLIGDNSDLQIYHDGSNTYFDNLGTGSVVHRIQSGDIYFQYYDGSSAEDMAVLNKNGAVVFYYDNAEKLRANPGGIKVTGNIACDGDNQKLILGAGDDLQIYHDGTHSYLTNTTGDLRITDTGGGGIIIGSDSLDLRNSARDEKYLTGNVNGAAKLYYDNSIKLETTSWGADVGGTLRADTLQLDGSDHKLQIGASQQWEIYNDGTENYFQTGAVTTHFRTDNGNRLTIKSDGNVQMQGSGGKNLEWKNATGLLTFTDNAQATFGTGDDLEIWHNGTYSAIKADNLKIVDKANNHGMITAVADGAVGLRYDNVEKIATKSNGANVIGGNLSVYADENNHATIYGIPNGTGIYASFLGYNSATTKSCGMTTAYGTNVYIDSSDNGTLDIRSPGTGAISLYNNGNTTLTLDSSNNATFAGKIDVNQSAGKIGNSNSSATTYIYGDDLRFTNAAITATNAIIDTNGLHLDTTSPTAANGLNDYEEGTWTPTIVSGGWTNLGSAVGHYTKIGNIVHASIANGALTGTGDSSALSIGGLPFGAANWTPGSMYAQDYNSEGTEQATIAVNGDVGSNTVLRVVEWGNEAIGTDFGAGYFVIQITYRTT